MGNQGIEVEFFPVGDGEHSGDAITVRYGTPGDYKIMVYDGGTKKSGEAIVRHVRKHYGTNRVDFVVNSHPDGDHASGLSVVLEELSVGQLWMHRPWEHSDMIRNYFHDGRMTDASLAERLKRKMGAAHELEAIAAMRKIPIFEPFQGDQIGIFQVLSPDENWYTHELIREFAKSPMEKKAALTTEGFSFLKSILESIIDYADEKWGFESLREDVCTSAENESSVVLFGEFADNGVLLTGDAGIRALNEVSVYAGNVGLDLPRRITFAQVPHHGSRNNVSTSALDRIFGPATGNLGDVYRRSAFISASKEADKHPDLAVINAFLRRGFGVFQTKGIVVRHSRGMLERDDMSPATSLPFSDKVRSW